MFDQHELLGARIVMKYFTGFDLVHPAVQVQVAASETCGHDRIGLQVLELYKYVLLGRGGQQGRTAQMAIVLAHDMCRGQSVTQPLAHERQSPKGLGIEHPLHSAAVGVTANDDVLDLQFDHGILDRSRFTIVADAVGRHHVADVADDEQLAWFRVGDEIGIDPRIGTDDQQGNRLLPLHQAFEQAEFGWKYMLLKVMNTVD